MSLSAVAAAVTTLAAMSCVRMRGRASMESSAIVLVIEAKSRLAGCLARTVWLTDWPAVTCHCEIYLILSKLSSRKMILAFYDVVRNIIGDSQQLAQRYYRACFMSLSFCMRSAIDQAGAFGPLF